MFRKNKSVSVPFRDVRTGTAITRPTEDLLDRAVGDQGNMPLQQGDVDVGRQGRF